MKLKDIYKEKVIRERLEEHQEMMAMQDHDGEYWTVDEEVEFTIESECVQDNFPELNIACNYDAINNKFCRNCWNQETTLQENEDSSMGNGFVRDINVLSKFDKNEYIKDMIKECIYEAERVGHRWDKGSYQS